MTREFIMTLEFDKVWNKLGLTDGLRKMRFALNTGKSCGIRVLYVDFVQHKETYLISAYSKNKKSNLNASEKSMIKKMIELLKKSADERRA